MNDLHIESLTRTGTECLQDLEIDALLAQRV